MPLSDVRDLRQVRLTFRAREQRILRLDVPEERSRQAVVVGLENRIELVVVAARALNRQAEHSTAERGDDVVEVLVPPLRVVLFTKVHAGTGAEEPGGDPGLVGRPVELIAGDLFLDEPVEGLVPIERGNDVVAISPGVGSVVVLLEAVRVRVPRYVQPVATPTLAVVRGSQELFDHTLPRVGPRVGQELRRFLGRGR